MNPQNTSSVETDPALNGPVGGTSRRSVIAGAAWALPVVALSIATPMAAASVAPQLVLDAPDAADVGEQLTVSARLVDANGLPMVGESVTFTVSPTSVGVFGAASASVTVQTNAAGEATVTNLNIRQAGTLSVVAMGAGATDTRAISVEASTGTIEFDPDMYTASPNSIVVLTGRVTRDTGNRYPTSVSLSYLGAARGPASVLVNAGGGFTVPDVQMGSNVGSVTAAAAGFGQAVASISIIR